MHYTPSTQKRIAVIGAGFCGLAICYELAEHFNVTLFEKKSIGAGASGIAAGLLHYYVGAQAKKNWRGEEGLAATLQLLKVSSKALNRSIWQESGILRQALTLKQQQKFIEISQLYDNVQWLEGLECQQKVPGCENIPGLFIKNGLSVDCMSYLQGLWLACQNMNVVFEESCVKNLEKLTSSFDAVIVAAGACTRKFSMLSDLGIHPVKGQILELKAKPPIIPLNSQIYIMSHPLGNTCVAGSTFEQEFKTEEVDISFAENEIMPKAIKLYPQLEQAQIIGCQAGIRASSPKHMPIWRHVTQKIWVISGMGSKGLLYHALGAKELAAELTEHWSLK